MSTATPLLTYEDLRRLPDDGKRYELIDGRLVELPSPTRRHMELARRLFRVLDGFADAGDLGRAYFAPIDVYITPTRVVQPDLLFIAKDRFGIYGPDKIEGAPDLVVEIHSPSTGERDRTEKAALYAAAGVREHWRCDPDARTFAIDALGAGGYETVAAAGHLVPSVVLPGLVVDVQALFEGVE